MKTFKIDGEEFRVIKEYDTFYMCIGEFGFNLKRIFKAGGSHGKVINLCNYQR
jgi:hypothetical protein